MEFLVAINLPALLAFTIVASFSPGPNTISTASLVLTSGYRKSLRYQTGILTGFFLVMVGSGFVASAITDHLPHLISAMRIAGAIYILYLAWKILRSSLVVAEEISKPLGFLQGMFLQLLNAKTLLLGLTVYATFLVSLPPTLLWRVASASFFTAIAILALLLYSFFGVALLRLLRSPRSARTINTLFALALVYTAIALLWPVLSS